MTSKEFIELCHDKGIDGSFINNMIMLNTLINLLISKKIVTREEWNTHFLLTLEGEAEKMKQLPDYSSELKQ